MFRKILFLMIISLIGCQVKAVDSLDKFLGTHCLSACNGPGPNCDDCQMTARELMRP